MWEGLITSPPIPTRHTHAHTYAHTYIHTHAHTHTHTYTHVHTHTHMHTHIHTCTHARTCICTPVYVFVLWSQLSRAAAALCVCACQAVAKENRRFAIKVNFASHVRGDPVVFKKTLSEDVENLREEAKKRAQKLQAMDGAAGESAPAGRVSTSQNNCLPANPPSQLANCLPAQPSL